jgi:hypothetical protein
VKLQSELSQLRERVSDLESDFSQSQAQLESIRSQRPKTAKKQVQFNTIKVIEMVNNL